MIFSTYVRSEADLQRCATSPGVQDVLLETELLAREGHLRHTEAETLAITARTLGLRPILVWNILMPQRVLTELKPHLVALHWSVFDAVRVQDVGAAQWLQEHVPTASIQWNVETGNHNLDGLLSWAEIWKPQLERLILSIELPEDKISRYCRELSVPCELLGVGRILLFYSPRSLLAPHVTPAFLPHSTHTEGIAVSEHTNYKPLPVMETRHGTFLYLDKDQFILDRMSSLWQAGLYAVCLDLRHVSKPGEAATLLPWVVEEMQRDPVALRQAWPRPTRAPFFKTNNTTGQFSRMKSKHHGFRNDHALAEILATEKPDYMVIQALRSFSVRDVSQIMLPSGESVDLAQPLEFRTLHNELVEHAEPQQILIGHWIKKACPGALLRRSGADDQEERL